jgi:oxygen-dependent protoporphyrinogen oxidase
VSVRSIAVVGGGITGLAAAHAAMDSGATVTLFEGSPRLGGVIRTTPFAGHPGIDEGADAFLARLPWATDLAKQAGIGDTLTSPATGKAAVWWNGLRHIPEGLLLGVPTDLASLARSRLISRRGQLRAAIEPLLPRTDVSADSIGRYVRARFGDEVHERLVDPLIGSIYAADTDEFSLAAIPQLAELAGRSRSMLLAARHRPPAGTGPIFYAPLGGMGTFVDALARSLARGGATLRCDAPVQELAADGSAWRVDGEPFDAVVLACPARVAAALLEPLDASAAATLAGIPTAGVALVTLAVPRHGWPSRLDGLSGYLVPKPQQRLVTAVSFGSQKWSHWASPHHVILRASLGRDGLAALHLDDEHLLTEVLTELDARLEIAAQPTDVRVSRWPDAFPQYRPHHGTNVAAAERRLPRGLALAGASYHGIGIPTCVRSGQQAVATLFAQ